MPTEPSTTPEVDSGSPPTGAACSPTRLWIRARILGVEPDLDDREARAHLRACPTCLDEYRIQMAEKARLGRAVARSGAGGAGHDGVAGIATPRLAPRHRRLLVVVALSLAIVGVVRMGGSLRPDPTLGIEWLAGELFVAGEPVGASFGPRSGLRGDLVQTGDDGRARVRLDAGSVHVDPNTTLLVESAVARRVRLVGGSVKLEGAARVLAPFGLVEVEDGAAHVLFEDEHYTIGSLAGSVRLTTAAGTRAIAPGDSVAGGL